jgi:heptosyltransferase-2
MQQGKVRMIQSILIVKIGAIGDVVMSLPMLSLLREKHPDAFITWVCGETVTPLIEATSLVNRIISVNEKKLFQSGLRIRLLTLLKLWRELFFQSFDLVITAHSDARYRIISFFCRKKQHRFFDRKGKRPFPVPGRYHLNEYVRLANPNEGPNSPVPSFPKLRVMQPSHRTIPSVILAPGGAKNALADDALRRWPISHYVELAKRLSSHQINLIITGSETDKWIEPYFSEIPYRNLLGKLSLIDFISLLRESDLLITHDSGPLHLSKLANCQTIALFGPTNPFEKVGQNENIHVFWGGKDLPCRPCYDGKKYAQCAQNLCLQKIHPEEVAKKALEILSHRHPTIYERLPVGLDHHFN